jgi:hypothetical protein
LPTSAKSDQGGHARKIWAVKGKQAFEADPATYDSIGRTVSAEHR